MEEERICVRFPGAWKRNQWSSTYSMEQRDDDLSKSEELFLKKQLFLIRLFPFLFCSWKALLQDMDWPNTIIMWKKTGPQQGHFVPHFVFNAPLLNSFVFFHRLVCERKQVTFFVSNQVFLKINLNHWLRGILRARWRKVSWFGSDADVKQILQWKPISWHLLTTTQAPIHLLSCKCDLMKFAFKPLYSRENYAC